MTFLTALLLGILFGAGLILSGMSDPANVLDFLDVAGDWNPSLAFVMGGAIAVAAPAFAWMRTYRHTLFGTPVTLPQRTGVTGRLLAGSALFGVGWGVAGLCPGPALVLAGADTGYGVLFAGAMAVGLVLSGRWTARDGGAAREAVAGR